MNDCSFLSDELTDEFGGQRVNNEFFRRITTVTENIKTLYLKPTLENVLLSYTIKNIKLPLR